MLGHVGDGNFHQAMFYLPNDAIGKQKVADCVDTMVKRAIEMEGTVSVGRLYHLFCPPVTVLTVHGRVSMVLALGRR